MSVPSGSAVSLPPVTAAGLPAAVPYTPPCTVVTVKPGTTARVLPVRTTFPAAVAVPSLTAPPAWVGLPAGARRVANEESGTNLSGDAREVAQFIRVVGGDGVVVAIVKIRGHEGAVPFCDVHVTLCDVDGGGVDV